MLGTIVNTSLIIVGASLGLVLKKALPDRISGTIMQGLGLSVVIIGLSGSVSSMFTIADGELLTNYTLLMIVSLAVGAIIGEFIKIEDRLDLLAGWCEKMFLKDNKSSTFVQGFVTATLVFCVGAMSIVGALEDGISGNTDILFAKSALDAVSAMIFASAMGIGVLFSAIAVALYQGSITLLAVFAAPYLNDEVITQISLIGSVLIMGIGLNMLKIAKIKVGNLLPSILVPVIYYIIRHLWDC